MTMTTGIRLSALAAVAAAALMACNPAAAQVTFYSSESAFDAALSGDGVEYTNNLISDSEATTGYSTASGVSVGDANIVGVTDQGYSLYGTPAGYYGLDYPVNSLQAPPTSSSFYDVSGGYTSLTFDGGTTAFGLNVFTVQTYDYLGSQTDTINLAVDGETGTATSASGSSYAADPSSGFIGFISTGGPVTSATLTGTGAEDFVDIAQITTVASTAPEPAVWALMMAGMGLTGGMLRYGGRRRLAAAA